MRDNGKHRTKYTDLNIRHLIDSGKMPGPHIDVSGPYLEGSDSFFPQMAALTEPEQARKTVAFWAAQGATSFKAYMNISEAVLGAAIKEAHHQGAKITGHLCAVDYRQAAALGIDDLEHGPIYTDSEFVQGRKKDTCPSGAAIVASWEKIDVDSAPVRALMNDLIKHNVAVTSTLPVFEASITTRPVLLEAADHDDVQRIAAQLSCRPQQCGDQPCPGGKGRSGAEQGNGFRTGLRTCRRLTAGWP